jgi:DDE superfamily endonuclease
VAPLIFLDERGATTQMTRRYAAPTTRGLEAPMTVAEPSDIFLAYLEQVLCARLRPGRVVIMDNLSAHNVGGVRELIEAAGARRIYLPPYSPDFNPIEQAWSKVKQIPRTLKAEALESAVAEALATITPENAIGGFSHCGCSLH